MSPSNSLTDGGVDPEKRAAFTVAPNGDMDSAGGVAVLSWQGP